MALTILLVAGSFLFGVGLTRFLMAPQYCPRCGEYMKSRAREVADWLIRRRKDSGQEGNGEGKAVDHERQGAADRGIE